MRLVRTRDDEEPRRVAVETVDDPGPPVLVTAGETVREQPVDERARAVSCRRVDDDSGGLVDHEQVVVLVCDPQVHRLGREARHGRGGGVDIQLLTAGQAVALRADDPVDARSARGQQAFGRGARADVRQLGEEPVEPRSRGRVRNA